MEGELAAAIAGVREAFASYPRRAVLEGCPHCRGSVLVDEHDLFSLTISLGNTVGSRGDVKSLLPVLFERLVMSDELDPSIVLGMLLREEWRTWPGAEQDAIDRYLEAVWRCLLADYPSRLGSFLDAVTFFDAVSGTGERVDSFLDIWDATLGSPADRHLADAVNGCNFASRRPSALGDWLRREIVRDRLHRAFERDHDAVWADDLARAYDLVRS
jgi:hypothetical protein